MPGWTWKPFYSLLESVPVGASMLAMVVNDNAGNLTPRGVLRPIASMLAPPVGASMLAMVVNDNAGNLTPRGVLRPIASMLAPTVGGCRLQHGPL
ncbi:hypothetical protein ASE98_03025 [Pseudomonas sp. Leaf48]|nr:hypothetical protein ASE98_03025 [Pseudomonas sp. Leaf48]